MTIYSVNMHDKNQLPHSKPWNEGDILIGCIGQPCGGWQPMGIHMLKLIEGPRK